MTGVTQEDIAAARDLRHRLHRAPDLSGEESATAATTCRRSSPPR